MRGVQRITRVYYNLDDILLVSSKLRDKVIADMKKLKGKNVSVDEELTPASAKLARDAYKHSSTIAPWSSHGTVFAKLKN